MMYVVFMKNFNSPIATTLWLLDSFRARGPKNVSFLILDTMSVEFMKNFHLTDSNQVMAVKLISAS